MEVYSSENQIRGGKMGQTKNRKSLKKFKSLNDELKLLVEQEETRYYEDIKNFEPNLMFFKVSVINEITSDPTFSVIKGY